MFELQSSVEQNDFTALKDLFFLLCVIPMMKVTQDKLLLRIK